MRSHVFRFAIRPGATNTGHFLSYFDFAFIRASVLLDSLLALRSARLRASSDSILRISSPVSVSAKSFRLTRISSACALNQSFAALLIRCAMLHPFSWPPFGAFVLALFLNLPVQNLVFHLKPHHLD